MAPVLRAPYADFKGENDMKRVAILRCLKSSASCAASMCVEAWKNSKTYGEETVEVTCVWTCNGCGEYMLPDPDGSKLRKKIDRMKILKLDALHLPHCTVKENGEGEKILCSNISAIAEELSKEGIVIIQGKP